jgi:radical SAM protein with 4Fe4S-binding SPASM domain
MVSLTGIGVGALAEPMKQKCFYPHYQLTVDYDGTVLLCPHDWSKRLKAGNLSEHSILEVWTSKVLAFARKRLAQADRNFSACRVCDVQGTLMGEEHATMWEAFYQSEANRSSVGTESSK